MMWKIRFKCIEYILLLSCPLKFSNIAPVILDNMQLLQFQNHFFQGMIDMNKLREIAQQDPELSRIMTQEPLQMTESEFITKFSLLWNLSGKNGGADQK